MTEHHFSIQELFMKKTLMIAAVIVASTYAMAAHATSRNDTWSKIFADSSLIVSTPYSGTFGPMGIFNACATDTEFQSISPVKVCTQYSYVPSTNDTDYPGHYDCVKTELRITSLPRTGTRHSCVKQDVSDEGNATCLQWADSAYTLSTTMEIQVVYGSGDAYNSAAFTKEYTVPACAQPTHH
jgi:hypothetical protein